MEVNFKSKKLKNSVKRVTDKAKNLDLDLNSLIVYGVSKEEGVNVTGKDIGKNLGEYFYFSGQKIAYNPYRANIGSIGLTSPDFKGLMSPAYIIFEVDVTIYPEFLLLYLKSEIGLRLIKWYGDRGGVRSSLRISDLGKIDFPDISYEEQKKFYNNYLNKKKLTDKLLAELSKQEKYLSQLRQSALYDAISGKLTENWRNQNVNNETALTLLNQIKLKKEVLLKEKQIREEPPVPEILKNQIPFPIPNSWKWCYMQELCSVITSGSTPQKSDYSESGIPYLKVYNIRDQKIDFDYKPQFINETYHKNNLKRSILEPGDVIINTVGPPLGKTAIVTNQFKEWNCNQAIALFKLIDKDMTDWIYTFFLSKDYLKRIEVVGSAGQDNISLSKCKKIEIPIPPKSEQKAIIKFINKLMLFCVKLEADIQNDKLKIEQLLETVLGDFLGIDNYLIFPEKKDTNNTPETHRKIIYDNKTILMELVELLKKHGQLHAEDLWKMSKHFDSKNIAESIDKFYADLKEKIEVDYTVKEVKNKKGYLELV